MAQSRAMLLSLRQETAPSIGGSSSSPSPSHASASTIRDTATHTPRDHNGHDDDQKALGRDEKSRRRKRAKYGESVEKPRLHQSDRGTIIGTGRRRKERAAFTPHTMEPTSEDCFAELLRVAEAHLASSTAPSSPNSSSRRDGMMHADHHNQHLAPNGSQSDLLDWSSFLTGTIPQQQHSQRQNTTLRMGEKGARPMALSACDECHAVPAPCLASTSTMDQCCMEPCSVVCPLSPSGSASALACSASNCCDEIPAVLACQDAQCATSTTTIPCEDVRCLDPKSKGAHTMEPVDSCSSQCDAALEPCRQEKKLKKSIHSHQDETAGACPTCDSGENQRYSSFQELLDCWCCSDHELEQCCTSKPDECASVVEACETCCLEESVTPSGTLQPAQKETPTISLSTRSRSTSHSVSLSSFSSPGESYDQFGSTGTVSDYWSSGSRGGLAGSNGHTRGYKDDVRLLDCIFEEDHMHNEAGACVPPALTMYKRDGYGDGASASQHASFTCHWAGCGMQCSSIDDLASHVNGTHLNLPGKSTSSAAPSASSNAWDADQGHSLRCMWDACQMHDGSASGEPSMLPSWQESNLILQHILQAHVGIEDAPSPSSSSGVKRKRRETQGAGGYDDDVVAVADDRKDRASSSQSKDDVHQCAWQDCSLCFESHQALTEHITTEHVGGGKAEYECLWRGCSRGQRKFHQKQKMLRHLQTHTHHRPFVCEICKKRFSEANTLSQHRRTHTNERPYVCDHPGCGKSFAVAGSLTIHKRIHSGEKPFKCSWPGCDKAFSESSNLAKHHRIHSGAKPFECSEPGCNMSFARSDQLARHRRIHEKGNKRRESCSTTAE